MKASLKHRLVREFIKANITVSTAESCTGGLIAEMITDVPGSSSVLAGGVVSYTNRVKCEVLGVDPAILARESEVSLACAKAMAEGVRALTDTDIAVSATGYAGPGGGTEKDPVGTVYIGIATRKGSFGERFSAPVGASRQAVRRAAASRALELLLQSAAHIPQA